ncbi:MAG TPA: hypothetical protein VN651_02875 [Gemmatimonadaceae bacterium]|nr:hypothetical protein [Gemmatimonadaceae bacterium]
MMRTPAAVSAVSDLTRNAQVGTTLLGGVTVSVTDARGRPVQGASVAFAVTAGNGVVSPRVATTDANGQATSNWTIGTVVGANELTALVSGVSSTVVFEATGTPGPVTTISITPPSLRLLSTVDSLRINARSIDVFGNATTPGPSFVARDPTLVSIDPNGTVHALRRGASTYVLVAAGQLTDSVLVTVLAPGQSVCTGGGAPTELAVGQVLTGISGDGFCVHASSTDAEYALVPYFDSPVPGATIQLEARPIGIGELPLASTTLFSAAPRVAAPALTPDYAFESRLRDAEQAQMPARLSAARTWYGANRTIARSLSTTTVPAIGDLVTLNVNATITGFCANPDYRVGRVAAVTDRAIVIADTANPPGGFTDAEYQSIGVTFDTLVDPTDRAAFGSPSDIDNNGHVVMFFTRAVNELTSSGASSVVLGFFYQRDLLPKVGPPGPCAGSNQAEMFYLMVPDTGGVVNSNKRSKTQVVSFTNGTVAHEYQHLINASRRMYVNAVGQTFEEKWLDEGLAHIAEELNYYAATGSSPRQNIDASLFTNPTLVAAYNTFVVNNTRRYQTYLATTETQGPISSTPSDDDLPTRGAVWSFLRYAADHVAAGNENAFWFALVNSSTTGVANLTHVLGVAPDSLMRDWAISVFLDDNAPNVDPRFQQPSWNMRSITTNNSTSVPFGLFTRILHDGSTTSFQMVSNGVAFLRFTVPVGQDGLVGLTSGGAPLPSTVQLAIVRVH